MDRFFYFFFEKCEVGFLELMGDKCLYKHGRPLGVVL